MATQPDQQAADGASPTERPEFTRSDSEKTIVCTEKSEESEETAVRTMGGHLNATEDDILEAKEVAATLSLIEVRKTLKHVLKIHEGDPNFPHETIRSIKEFMANNDIMNNPNQPQHRHIIQEMKLEAALITSNSPYAEVRSVVDNTDDPTLPVSTLRVWVIGIIASICISFINQLFSIRLPPITLTADVAQLLAFPLGKAWERWVPRGKGITIPFSGGQRLELNPGRFNKKEHMVIAIMAGVSVALPYSNFIFWAQYLPFYFNQSYARGFGYMLTNNIATSFIGYGLAGVVRRFLVYPSYCVWPASLITIALNSALHDDQNSTVLGPFNKLWAISRYRFFFIAFGAMFVYYWVPNYLFTALSIFSWMSWIAPKNRELNVLTGGVNGMGMLNPLPTFDWNIVSSLFDPLMYPSFTVFNTAAGMFIAGLVMMGIWYTNVWNTAYLPINSNTAYDHFGMNYQLSQIVDERGHYDQEKFLQYSYPYLSPASIVLYFMVFCAYSAVVTHVCVYHRYEMALGFKSLWRSLKRGVGRMTKKGSTSEAESETDDFTDVHARLMKSYPEVSEWWYLAILAIATTLGCIGIAAWPTYVTPAVPFFGIAMCVVFVVPVGIATAMTGVPISLNILAEFFGGLIADGDALTLNFFKCYGFITCLKTLVFTNDLKVAHYLKIPPRVTFTAQIVGTLCATLVSTGVVYFQMGIENICTEAAPNGMSCPAIHTFFTASVLWGTIGPRKTFGVGAPYTWLLLGFPLGAAVTLIFWALKRKFPNVAALRKFHIAALFYGGANWGVYNFSYMWPAVPVAWFSWHFIRKRYLSFWSKYNYVLSAAFSAAIGLSAVVQFFGVHWKKDTQLVWWGNTVQYQGCELEPCTAKTLTPGERFYPWWDLNAVPAG